MQSPAAKQGFGPSLPKATAHIPIYGAGGVVRDHALVDWADYEELSQYRWHMANGGYAKRYAGGRPPKRRQIRMHRVILGLPPGRDDPEKWQVDHINGNPLDNRRCNLRKVTEAQNHQNRRKRPEGCYSQHRGVTFDKRRNKWIAQAVLNDKRNFIGYFDTEDKAAEAAVEWRRVHMTHATN